MITIKSKSEVEKMRLAGKITGDALRLIEKHIRPGVSTLELDKIVRTSKRAIRKLDEIAYTYFDKLKYPAKIDVAHGNMMEEAEEKLADLMNRYPEQKSTIYRLASVIGVHTGPGILGYTITPEYND